MDTNHIEHLIEVYLANGLSREERAEFEAHCNTCESCRKALGEAREFEAVVFQSLAPDRAPADLEQRLIDSFRTAVPQPTPQRRFIKPFFSYLFHARLLRLISIPAAALLLIIIGMIVMTPPQMRMAKKGPQIGIRPGGIFSSLWHQDKDAEKTKHYESADPVRIRGSINRKSPETSAAGGTRAIDWKATGSVGSVDMYYSRTKGEWTDIPSDEKDREKAPGVYDSIGVGGGAGGLGGLRGGSRKLIWDSKKGKKIQRNLPRGMGVGAPLDPARKIIKSATLTFEVDSFETAYQKVVAILTEVKGYIASSSTTKLPNGKVRGHIVIRILPERFDSVSLKLRALGELKNQKITSEDVTKHYIDLQARLKNSKALEERLIKLMKAKKGKIEEFLKIEKELANVREKVERFLGEIKYYDNLVSLATIRLEIIEKDIGKPFEYVQTQSANLSIAVSDVEAVYYRTQTIVHDLDGQIVEAQLTDRNRRARGTIKAYVDAEQFAGLLEQLKGLGEVKSAVVGRRQTSSEGTPGAPEKTPVRKERGLVNLVLNPPAGEYIQTQRARIALEVSEVESAYAKAQNIATEARAKILNGNLNRGMDQTVATIICQVEAERFRTLVDSLKGIGKVKSATMEEHQSAKGIDPKSILQAPIRKDPGIIELTIAGPKAIVSEERGIGATLRNTLKGSFGGLFWSLEMLVVGLATVGPWLILLILIIVLVRRWVRRPKTSGKAE